MRGLLLALQNAGGPDDLRASLSLGEFAVELAELVRLPWIGIGVLQLQMRWVGQFSVPFVGHTSMLSAVVPISLCCANAAMSLSFYF